MKWLKSYRIFESKKLTPYIFQREELDEIAGVLNDMLLEIKDKDYIAFAQILTIGHRIQVVIKNQTKLINGLPFHSYLDYNEIVETVCDVCDYMLSNYFNVRFYKDGRFIDEFTGDVEELKKWPWVKKLGERNNALEILFSR